MRQSIKSEIGAGTGSGDYNECQSIKEKIKEILAEVKETPQLTDTLSDDSDIITQVALDSLEIINFILKIEEKFDFEFNFDHFDYSHLKSIKIFSRFIYGQLPD
jgi:acyl carrier protein